MTRVFIDGREGTTGLQIYQRLETRQDITLLRLSEQQRKETACRKQALNSCDIAFLCLPDDAAREAVTLLENPSVVLIDASSAHRSEPGWVYGFAELSAAHGQALGSAKRIAVPGCHASGFVALVYPLVQAGLLSRQALLSCFSLSGYSGGGKRMIAAYEEEGRSILLNSPRQYALEQQHKHLKEMTAVTGLQTAPIFSPIVADYYCGMVVTVPLFAEQLAGDKAAVEALYASTYTGPLVRYTEEQEEGDFCAASKLAGRDGMEISVRGNSERMLLMARFDNLGKGASGAAVACMNLAMSQPITLGLKP